MINQLFQMMAGFLKSWASCAKTRNIKSARDVEDLGAKFKLLLCLELVGV